MKKEIVVAAVVQRGEERDSLNVIPMEVGEEDVGVHGTSGKLFYQLLAEVAEAGAAVKNVDLVVNADFDAGSISAITHVR